MVREKKLKILLLADSSSFHTERITAELRRQGCRVFLASVERGRIHHYHLPQLPIQSLSYLQSALTIRRLIRRLNPDVINPHFASGYGFAAALGTRGVKIPLVLNLWGSDILISPHKSFLHKHKVATALRAADAIIGDSSYLLTQAEKIISGTFPLKEVIPWGIERRYLSLYKGESLFAQPLKIIVPRPHEPVYNNSFILRAVAPLSQEGTIDITFPNFGSLTDGFKRDAAKISTLRIHFYDKMPRTRFLSFMATHDVYLSASRSDSSPASLIEAMALGLIPVAADIPGVREWLTPDTGFLYQEDNEEELRALIKRLLGSSRQYSALRQKNYARVTKEAIFEHNVAKQIELMEELAHRGKDGE